MARRVSALIVVLAVAVGCSSGSSSGNATQSSATTFCSTFISHYTALSGRGVREGDLQSAFEEIGPVLSDLERQAPAEVRTDVDRLTADLRSYADVMRKYGYNYERIQREATPEEQAKLGGDPASVTSINNIQRFIRDKCSDASLPPEFSDFS